MYAEISAGEVGILSIVKQSAAPQHAQQQVQTGRICAAYQNRHEYCQRDGMAIAQGPREPAGVADVLVQPSLASIDTHLSDYGQTDARMLCISTPYALDDDHGPCCPAQISPF
jgi:hypothetical protein